MKKAPPRPTKKPLALIVGALVLVTGSFLFASGSLLQNSDSLLSAAISAFTGKPTITITRSNTSPSGVISPGVNQNLATFNVKVNNVKWQGTLNKIEVQIPITGQSAGSVIATSLAAHYTYCIPSGVKYGYGYKGGACGTINLFPVSTTRSGNTYTLTFNRPIPVYPQQSYGAFIVSGNPGYTSSAALGIPTIQANIATVAAIGDQCRIVSYGYKDYRGASKKYSYSVCTKGDAAALLFGKGNVLKIKNPYGYSYKKPTTTTTTTVKPSGTQTTYSQATYSPTYAQATYTPAYTQATYYAQATYVPAYAQATYYTQATYTPTYAQATYYTQGTYYAQATYYSQATYYAQSYYQASYYSQGTYGGSGGGTVKQ